MLVYFVFQIGFSVFVVIVAVGLVSLLISIDGYWLCLCVFTIYSASIVYIYPFIEAYVLFTVNTFCIYFPFFNRYFVCVCACLCIWICFSNKLNPAVWLFHIHPHTPFWFHPIIFVRVRLFLYLHNTQTSTDQAMKFRLQIQSWFSV